MGRYGDQPITVSTDDVAGIDVHSADDNGDIDLSGAIFVRPSQANTFCPAQKLIIEKKNRRRELHRQLQMQGHQVLVHA